MKRLITLAAALLLGVSAFGQQALFGGPGVESPVINADGTVTFRYRAPKAIKVEVTGDFLPTQKI
jgi:enterochelin esterase family protein